MKNDRVDIRLEKSLLETLDQVRQKQQLTRSEWIRQSLRASMPKKVVETTYCVEQPCVDGTATTCHYYFAVSPVHARMIHAILTGMEIEESQDWTVRRVTS